MSKQANFSITGEYEGQTLAIYGSQLQMVIEMCLENATGSREFIQEVTSTVTDETDELSDMDIEALELYYNSL